MKEIDTSKRYAVDGAALDRVRDAGVLLSGCDAAEWIAALVDNASQIEQIHVEATGVDSPEEARAAVLKDMVQGSAALGLLKQLYPEVNRLARLARSRDDDNLASQCAALFVGLFKGMESIRRMESPEPDPGAPLRPRTQEELT